MPVYRCSFVSVLVCVCVNFTERLARVVIIKKIIFFKVYIDLMLNIAQLLIIVDVDYWMSMFDGF